MSAIDNWNAPRWADFTASPMANIDDYFKTEHSELERRRTTGMDSLCGTISEELQENPSPENSPEEEDPTNNVTLVETNDESQPSEEAPQNKVESPQPIKETKRVNKNVNVSQTRPRVLTSNVRRQSIARYRRRSDQYVPLAEALRKFQNGTPTRFRSNKSKDNNAGPLKKVKQTRTQLTCPMSPALLCKSRTRTASTVSEKTQPTAKPIAKSSSFPRTFPSTLQRKTINEKPLRKIEKIPSASSSKPKVRSLLPTVPSKETLKSTDKIPSATNSGPKVTTFLPKVPAMLKETLKSIEKIPSAKSSEAKGTMPPPKSSTMLKETDKSLNVPSSSKDTSILSSSMLSKSMRAHNTPRKKMAPTVVSTNEDMKIKEVEVLHFEIPIANVGKKITRPKPFSFETRNKELQDKKVKLKTQQEEAEKMKKTTFHAKAAPSSNVPKKTMSVLKPKEDNFNKANPTTRTLTFKERNELALKKKKELMDQMYEKEKKARVFHAKPAPTFKPVFVRGNSTENLRAGEKNKAKTRGISPAARQRGQSHESLVSGNQENEAPKIANPGCPKLKNPLMTEKQKLKGTTK